MTKQGPEQWLPAICPECGWVGSRRDCKTSVLDPTLLCKTCLNKIVEFHLIEISDIVAWKNNCGGECLSKQCIFDHNIYKLESLVCINSITGYFHTITVLVYANGKVYDMPRGPMSHMTYPLKGKTITKGTKGNPIGILQTLFFRHLHQKGEATAEEVKERYLKKGYVRI